MIDPAVADSRRRFRRALGGGWLPLDAAMGTRLIALGLRLEEDDPCLWNLSHPVEVAAIHGRDVAAGAQAVLTNTFGANRAWLRRFGGVVGRVGAINRAAVALARGASGPGRFVVGDIGPTAADGDGDGDVIVEQATCLVDAGVDALILETFRLEQAEGALARLVAAGVDGAVPLLVSLLDWPDPADAALARLTALGASAVGANCGPGMASALALAVRLRRATDLPLIVKPAAGPPSGPADLPGAFAAGVPLLRSLGPVLVGGCCGTHEGHVAALHAAWYDEHR